MLGNKFDDCRAYNHPIGDARDVSGLLGRADAEADGYG